VTEGVAVVCGVIICELIKGMVKMKETRWWTSQCWKYLVNVVLVRDLVLGLTLTGTRTRTTYFDTEPCHLNLTYEFLHNELYASS
jgi:hypothetical protein